MTSSSQQQRNTAATDTTLLDLMEGGGCKRVGIDVYTDGSCVGNGCHSATGGMGVFFGPNDPYNVSERVESYDGGKRKKDGNNRHRDKYNKKSSSVENGHHRITSQAMEVGACVRAIQKCLERADDDDQLHIRIYTDSDYVIYAVNHGTEKWIKQQLPLDRFYLEKLMKLLRASSTSPFYGTDSKSTTTKPPRVCPFSVTFVHISAHQAVPTTPYLTTLAHWFGNRDADRLATEASKT